MNAPKFPQYSFCAACAEIDSEIGFHLLHYDKGTKIGETVGTWNQMIFVLSGKIRITYDTYNPIVLEKDSMIYLSYVYPWNFEILEETEIIGLFYNRSLLICDLIPVQHLDATVKNLHYEFKSLDIRPILHDYLYLLRRYLSDTVQCPKLHTVKQQELGLIFLHYYEAAEQSNLFYHAVRQYDSFYARVMNHYREVKTVGELADKCGYSKSSFLREFKRIFKATPHSWIERQVAQHIHREVLDPSIPLKLIIFNYNFASASHFANYCRRHFGATPNEIRKHSLIDVGKENPNALNDPDFLF